MRKYFILTTTLLFAGNLLLAQSLTQPAGGGNIKSAIEQKIGVTNIKITWDAPGVKGREGKIWGTSVAHYGFQDLDFGTSKAAPWRAGANESTTISFSTDVTVEGKPLAAGKYGFFIAVNPDSCTLIFSKNATAWGSYFYNPDEDALRVTVKQKKNLPNSQERLAYVFDSQTENSTNIALEWEYWSIPFKVAVDLPKTVVDAMRKDLQGEAGFYYENYVAAAQFCLDRNYNLEEALVWANAAINPPFGVENFTTESLKAQVYEKMNNPSAAEKAMKAAMEKGNVQDLHGYGRQLIAQKKYALALEVFEANYKKHGDVWPVQVGLARGYSGVGDLKKALEHAKIALSQAPDEVNKKNLEEMVKTLKSGKPLAQ